MNRESLDVTLANVGAKATLAGAGTTGAGWLFTSEFALAVGMLCAVMGFALNAFFSWRHDRRRQLEHEARMQAIQERCDI